MKELLRRGTGSAYHLYGKPGNSGKNSDGTAHPGGNFPEKSDRFRGTTFFPFLPKRPKFSVPFVWITSARLHVGILSMVQVNPVPVFGAKKKYQYHLTEIFHRNFRTNSKRSGFSFHLRD